MSTPARQPAPPEEREEGPRPGGRPAGGRVWSALLKRHGRDVVADQAAGEGGEAEHRVRQAEEQYRVRREREEMFERQARLLERRLAERPTPGAGSPQESGRKPALKPALSASTRGEWDSRSGTGGSTLRRLLRRLRRLLPGGAG